MIGKAFASCCCCVSVEQRYEDLLFMQRFVNSVYRGMWILLFHDILLVLPEMLIVSGTVTVN